MNSTLKRRKSISSQAASISAWCAVFDWPSIVAALSVSRHGPGEQLGGAQEDALRGPPTASATSPATPRPRRRSPAATCSAPPWWTSARTCARVVRHHGRRRVAGRDVLAADHERDLDALARHLREAALERGALGAPRRVVAAPARCGPAADGSARACSRDRRLRRALRPGKVGGRHEHPDHEAERRGPEGRADERPVGRGLGTRRAASTATPPAMPARPNQRRHLARASAASEEPMITVEAQAALGAATAGERDASAAACSASSEAPPSSDDAGEEPVRVVADDPRVQAAEEPEQRERGAGEERARRPARGSSRARVRAPRAGRRRSRGAGRRSASGRGAASGATVQHSGR